MKTYAPNSLRLLLVVSVLLAVGLTTFALAQRSPSTINVGGTQISGLPDDWSHHHVIFSNPGTAQEATQKGTYDHWFSIVNDPRYVIQQLKRHAPAQGPAGQDVAKIEEGARSTGWHGLEGSLDDFADQDGRHGKEKIKKDWNRGLGSGTPITATYPATWSASFTQANCLTDYAVYVTGVTGSSSHASIVAYYNLYSGCPTGGSNPPSVPSVYWAYNTGGNANTSPAVSLDGTQIAFVQHTSSNVSSVVLIKWAQSTSTQNESVTHPLTLANQSSGANYRNCTPTAATPCMFTMTLTNNTLDTHSSPYYDYTTDSLYVGDNSAYLHKFTGVFRGTPSATEPSPFPVQPTTGQGFYALTSPVVDGATGVINIGNLGGGSFMVSTAGTTLNFTEEESFCEGTAGVDDSPVMDPTGPRTYLFLDDELNDDSIYDVIVSFSYNSAGYTGTGAVEAVGMGEYNRGGCSHQASFFSGNFDNVYYESTNQTGNLWVVGSSYGPSMLYRVPITSNSMGTPTAVATLSNAAAYGYGSPVTEFCNNGVNPCTSNGTITTAGKDYIFFSVYEGTLAGCTSTGAFGCVVSYNITDPASPSLSGAQNLAAPTSVPLHATGGIVVDNALSSPTGTSNIYFNTRSTTETCGDLTIGICAIQASQSAP